MSRFIISDPHFGHRAVIGYANRPFESVKEMEDTIVENINSMVNKHDTLFWLGDMFFCGRAEKERIMARIRCKNNYLILGNHDRGSSVKHYLEIGFKKVSEYPIIVDGFLILSHEPVFLNPKMPYANLHGHVHQNSYAGTSYVNCCVEATNYKPLNLDELKAVMVDD